MLKFRILVDPEIGDWKPVKKGKSVEEMFEECRTYEAPELLKPINQEE